MVLPTSLRSLSVVTHRVSHRKVSTGRKGSSWESQGSIKKFTTKSTKKNE